MKKKLTLIFLLLILALTACSYEPAWIVLDGDETVATFPANTWECKSFEMEIDLLVSCVNESTGENESYLATGLELR